MTGDNALNFNTFCHISITCISVALCYHPVHFMCSLFPSNFAPNALSFHESKYRNILLLVVISLFYSLPPVILAYRLM